MVLKRLRLAASISPRSFPFDGVRDRSRGQTELRILGRDLESAQGGLRPGPSLLKGGGARTCPLAFSRSMLGQPQEPELSPFFIGSMPFVLLFFWGPRSFTAHSARRGEDCMRGGGREGGGGGLRWAVYNGGTREGRSASNLNAAHSSSRALR